jgi:hypothetical protein
MTAATANPVQVFRFERDTFDYPHELVWKYNFDPDTGAMSVRMADPPPTYYHRCFVMVRATRQFFYHARFNPELPPVDADTYQKLIGQVVRRNVRQRCPETERIVIPGFLLFTQSLAHDFSRAKMVPRDDGEKAQSILAQTRPYSRAFVPIPTHHH